jgi:hypothetical protein
MHLQVTYRQLVLMHDAVRSTRPGSAQVSGETLPAWPPQPVTILCAPIATCIRCQVATAVALSPVEGDRPLVDLVQT